MMNPDISLQIIQNKVILLISPQSWGSLYISKNHYALELAKNNIVYFLCPQTQSLDSSYEVHLKSSDESENLFIVYHKLFFPFQIKFHCRPIFKWLMRIHTGKILKKINREIDIVWSFDLGNYFPFSFFSKVPLKIFHPVDEPLNEDARASALDSDVIFSVTHEILAKYKEYHVPKHFINHGLSSSFLNIDHSVSSKDSKEPIRVGISGNLRRNDIDREVLLKIFKKHPEIIFDCWGEYQSSKKINSKIDHETEIFIDHLKSIKNVRLHGILNPDELARAYINIDAFLICYDVKRDQSKGTNYHKVMEFISTGKVIISNNITTYNKLPNLVQMVASRESNQLLPDLFSQVINNLKHHNAAHFQNERIEFSRNHIYSNQLLLIDQKLKTII